MSEINHAHSEDTKSSRPFFRREVTEFAKTKQHGDVLNLSSPSYQVITAVCLFFAIAVIAFFYFFSTARKVECLGVVVPANGLAKIAPIQTGIISSKLVTEGEDVAAEQPLFIVSGESSGMGSGQNQGNISRMLRDRIASYENEQIQSDRLLEHKRSVVRKQIDDLNQELARIVLKTQLQEKRVRLASDALARHINLQATSFVSAAQVQEKDAELIDQQQRLQELSSQKASIERDIINISSSFKDAEIERIKEAEVIKRNILATQQDLTESERRRESVVRAPYAGKIVSVTGEIGQLVSQSTSLATIIPANAKLEVELYAPSQAIGFLSVGQRTLVRYRAYPFQKFGQHQGTVRQVASASQSKEELGIPGPKDDQLDRFYRVRISIDKQSVLANGVPQPLKVGMALDASVVLEERRLYEWILDPLYSITGKKL